MKKWRFPLLTACLLFASACSTTQVEVIDLNKVLDVMTATIDSFADQKVEGAEEGANAEEVLAAAASDNQVVSSEFLATYTKNLNEAKVMSTPVGTLMRPDGAIEGFQDSNADGKKDSGEQQLFTVEIDVERARLIATDTQNSYHRDSGFHISPGSIFMGYMLGSMLSRQRASGISPSRYSNMKMSPRNYHSSAVSSARARASGGSRSFSSGK
ncbi:hypothetical protein [Acanthopleuribacter pedis]|uniref:DUF4247 domain-containing protein n=1 Tax=Acanthopleuribacter pedis TaxID=442870 RepID=A0A8J7U4Q9_9BACT|nr:hypothetical protein [Acanthopleuribacter pedis]MBO1317254.1 hypothetical protein [Acanthopleuribacter pedis]MBO1318561.1 hypothetical protein [Acanthopleuribacter pedis]